MKFKLTLLSPLYSGGREQTLSPNRFVTRNGRCCVLSQKKLTRWLNEQGKAQSYLDYIGRGERRILDFLKEVGMINSLPDLSAYSSDCSGLGNFTSDLHPFVRDGYHRPFIPGSSTKGAIRSAFLFDRLSQAKDRYLSDPCSSGNAYSSLVNLIQQAGTDKREKMDEGLIVETLQGYQLENETGSPFTDILRALQVKDAPPLGKDDLVVAPIKVLKEEQNGWQLSGFTVYAETIFPAQNPCTYDLTVKIDLGILKDFSSQNPEISLPLPIDDEKKAAGELLKICRRFAEAQLAEEIRFFERVQQRAAGNKKRAIERILDLYRNHLSQANLWLGWGSGLTGTTLLALLDPDERKALRERDPFKGAFVRRTPSRPTPPKASGLRGS